MFKLLGIDVADTTTQFLLTQESQTLPSWDSYQHLNRATFRIRVTAYKTRHVEIARDRCHTPFHANPAHVAVADHKTGVRASSCSSLGGIEDMESYQHLTPPPCCINVKAYKTRLAIDDVHPSTQRTKHSRQGVVATSPTICIPIISDFEYVRHVPECDDTEPALMKDKRVLDIGWGMGMLSNFAAKAGAKMRKNCRGEVDMLFEVCPVSFQMNEYNMKTIIRGN
ncbi:hypothetical protein M422DRAFT_56923 [Sphaerobolus stellatus SS14]|uniref:Unplaced genomic scaffold SPHSTscaffold_682, whole genome shotgun sequence n=1 Tax=Sphaerobolus stellatus (strain SS14) TaxID=990650 RepID=A0A0C9TMW9_SPHS4|nr:hypothetical protein M422DRAFT_56923 [Sphaerobolus stellatus SS14]